MFRKEILILIVLFLSTINLQAQDSIRASIIVNAGYPVILGVDRNVVKESKNIIFVEIGIEKKITPIYFYSVELSSYNLIYESMGGIGELSGKILMTRLKPSINLIRKISLSPDINMDIGLGIIGRFDYDISLEESSKYHSRINLMEKDIGFQAIVKHYILSNHKNQFGIIMENNWYYFINKIDIGIGITYKHLFFK